jgi:protein arginine phosphatase
MPAIAFICTANRCRSVMAHAIFVAEAARRRLSIETYSAGVCDFTDLPPVNDTINTCLKHGTLVPKEESTWAGKLPLDSIDRFLVMERHHADALIEQFGVSADRVNLLGEFDPRDRGQEIADPIGQGTEVYDRCYRQIHDCIVNYLDGTNAD